MYMFSIKQLKVYLLFCDNVIKQKHHLVMGASGSSRYFLELSKMFDALWWSTLEHSVAHLYLRMFLSLICRAPNWVGKQKLICDPCTKYTSIMGISGLIYEDAERLDGQSTKQARAQTTKYYRTIVLWVAQKAHIARPKKYGGKAQTRQSNLRFIHYST